MTRAALDTLFERAGCARTEPSVLQPADPFLNAAGEAFRKSLFVTAGNDGQTLCLRPDFTIPVCLAHRGGPARYHYRGKVFRQPVRAGTDGAREFEQAGVEALGETDFARADADMVRLALAAIRLLDRDIEPLVLIGDQAFFETLVAPVGLPKIWRERLTRAFGDADLVDTMLQRMVSGPVPTDERFAHADLAVLTREVAAMMREHGLSGSGGRSSEAIAKRFLKKRDEQKTVSTEVAEICQLFLALECGAGRVADTMARFGTQHGIDFSAAAARYEERAARLRDLEAEMIFAASFGRRLDYYTGFVFEIYDAVDRAKGPLAGGGRYDRLAEMLGGAPLPAVGFSLWLDRISEGGRS